MRKPKQPKPPRMTDKQLKRGGFSNSLWRLKERDEAMKAAKARREGANDK